MKKEKKTYRCTRMMPYSNKGCAGYSDPTCRQGHYFLAESELVALALMIKENNPGECVYGYTVEAEEGQVDEDGHPCFFFWDAIMGMKEYLKVHESYVMDSVHKKYHNEFEDRERLALILDKMSRRNEM